MDSSILRLFTTEDILLRLSEKACTGALHVFKGRDSANIYFCDGVITGACKGLSESEDVVSKALEWDAPRLIWQEDEQPPENLKKIEINFPEWRARPKQAIRGWVATAKPEGAKSFAEPVNPSPEPARPLETNPIMMPPSRASSSGPLDLSKLNTKTKTLGSTPPFTSSAETGNLVPVTTPLKTQKGATILREDDSFEEALMRKHQLALVSVGDTPPQKWRIIRSSNLVGRNPACDFILNHGSISRQHCVLQIMERGLHVKDLSTTNGTKVNGIPLTEGYVSVGDKLTIGHLDFVVEKDELEQS